MLIRRLKAKNNDLIIVHIFSQNLRRNVSNKESQTHIRHHANTFQKFSNFAHGPNTLSQVSWHETNQR